MSWRDPIRKIWSAWSIRPWSPASAPFPHLPQGGEVLGLPAQISIWAKPEVSEQVGRQAAGSSTLPWDTCLLRQLVGERAAPPSPSNERAPSTLLRQEHGGAFLDIPFPLALSCSIQGLLYWVPSTLKLALMMRAHLCQLSRTCTSWLDKRIIPKSTLLLEMEFASFPRTLSQNVGWADLLGLRKATAAFIIQVLPRRKKKEWRGGYILHWVQI